MENHQHTSVFGTFMRGFAGSAASGALMSGIFYSLGFAAQTLQIVALGLTLSSALPAGLLMVGAVGLFGGVMAVKREADMEKAHTNPITQATLARSKSVSHVLAPTVSPAMDEAPETTGPSWAERTGTERTDRIQEILANGSMTDKDRAAAILATREQTANAEATR